MFIAGRSVVIPLNPPRPPGCPTGGRDIRNQDTFIAGRTAVFPPVLPRGQLGPPRKEGRLSHAGWEVSTELAALIEYGVDRAQGVGKWQAIEFHVGWESPGVPLADALNAHNRIHRYEVGEFVEAAEGGHRRKLFRPLNDGYFSIGDIDATDECIEAIDNRGRIEFGRCHCHEVVQD